jgi:tetratricopeptide (TPR) repeat protein
MVMSAQPSGVDSDPTPEFNEQCTAVVDSWQRGDLPFQEAIARLNTFREKAAASGHVANQARTEQLLGNIQHFHGNLTTSVQHWERARTLFAQVNNQISVAGMDLNIGESFRFKGDFARAVRMFRTTYNIASELGDLRIQTIATTNEGLALVAMGQHSAARNAFEKAFELLAGEWARDDQTTWVSLLCENHHGMATIHLEAGDLMEAWKQSLKALELTKDAELPMQRGYANRIAGQVVTQLGSAPAENWPDDPDEYFRTALESFREVNAEAELARTMYAQALSLAARGRRNTAARKLQQVMIIFSRLGMIDDAARAAAAQLSIT